MNDKRARTRTLSLPVLAWGLFLLFASACHVDQSAVPEEKYVTVRLHDSLSRFDSVEILVLAGGNPVAVVGEIWLGRLESPGDIPTFRLDDDEQRNLIISVKAWDADGRLALEETIAKVDGKQVVTGIPIAQPSPRLKSLSLEAGRLAPDFQASQHAYAVSVPYSQASLSIRAEPEYAPADIFFGIAKTTAGQASEAIPLEVGDNRLTVTVRAADTTDQYVITATREAMPEDTVIVIPPDTSHPAPYKDWKHKGMVLLDFGQMGNSLGFKVVDFPLLLRLARENFVFAQAAAGGSDVRFATADGNPLAFEIARWDMGAQAAEIYIRVDTLTNASTILMYWGNAEASAVSSPASVFRPAKGWGGVWHLEEDGLASEYLDATGNFDAKGVGSVPGRKDGMVGSAQEFTADSTPQWIELPRDYELGTEAFTLHMWVKKAGIGHYRLLSKDGPKDSNQRYLLEIAANSGQVGFGSNLEMHMANVYVGVGNWMLLGLTFDGAKAHLFVDGMERESWNYKVNGKAPNKVFLGATNDAGMLAYRGVIDELWTSPRDRGKDYMRLIYENQKSWSSFAKLLPL